MVRSGLNLGSMRIQDSRQFVALPERTVREQMWRRKGAVVREQCDRHRREKREQSLKKNQFTTCDENTLLVMYMLFITLYLEQKDF